MAATDYAQNMAKFQEISTAFNHIPSPEFYSVHLEIAVDEYVKYLNYLSQFACVEIKNSGTNPSATFAIKIHGKFIANDKLVKKCIQQAKNKNKYTKFGFLYTNIVLDKLQAYLQSK